MNGLDAIDTLKAVRPDMVVLDLNIPFIDGFGVLDAIRADALYATMPVVVLSQHSDEQTRDDAHNRGCDEFFAKPVDLRVFMEEINRIIPMRKSA